MKTKLVPCLGLIQMNNAYFIVEAEGSLGDSILFIDKIISIDVIKGIGELLQLRDSGYSSSDFIVLGDHETYKILLEKLVVTNCDKDNCGLKKCIIILVISATYSIETGYQVSRLLTKRSLISLQ